MHAGDEQRDYLIATDLYKEGRYEEALRLLDVLQRERPNSKHVLYYRGLCLVALGRLTEANNACDRLSSHQSESGRRMTAKLSARIAEHVRREYGHAHTSDDAPAIPPTLSASSDDHQHERLPTSSASRQVSRSRGSEDFASDAPVELRKGYLLVGGLILCLILAGAIFAVRQYQVRAAEGAEPAPLPVPEGPVPDKYLEVTTYYPAERDRPYSFVVFSTPWDGTTSFTDMGRADECAGRALVEDWAGMERDAGRALRAYGSAELLGGVPRNNMMRTLVLPRQTTGFSGPLQGKDIKAFLPGPTTELAPLIAACGKPARVEPWECNAKHIGINGKVLWWGRVGVAADGGASTESGSITHVLIREYPSPEPGPEAKSEAQPAVQSEVKPEAKP